MTNSIRMMGRSACNGGYEFTIDVYPLPPDALSQWVLLWTDAEGGRLRWALRRLRDMPRPGIYFLADGRVYDDYLRHFTDDWETPMHLRERVSAGRLISLAKQLA